MTAHRNCREPHPTARWKGLGGVIEPHRCVEVAGHLGDHRAVTGVSNAAPLGTPLTWP